MTYGVKAGKLHSLPQIIPMVASYYNTRFRISLLSLIFFQQNKGSFKILFCGFFCWGVSPLTLLPMFFLRKVHKFDPRNFTPKRPKNGVCVQGCISCGTCSYPELTDDHVLTSAYVKIFRIVTRNAVNKSF